jgi:autotransporter translocation and assembly factor TamB
MATAIWAGPEPLLGTWRLDSQEVNGQKTNSEPLTLRISQAGDRLAFAFSVPVNNVYFVSMSYAVKLDGSEADVKNARGEKVGAVRMTAAGRSRYNLILKAPNRPDSSGKLTVSPDGKTLTSETDAAPSGPSGRPVHSKQLFSRQ